MASSTCSRPRVCKDAVVGALVHPQGDLTLLDPATGAPKFAADEYAHELADDLHPA